MAWEDSDRAARLPDDWPRRRRRVLRRDGYLCQLQYEGVCTVRATDVDHIERGDDHSESNLQAACPDCHAVKSGREGAAASVAARAARPRTRPAEPHPGLL